MFFWVHDHYRAGGLALSDRIEGTEDDDGGVGGRDLSGLLLGQGRKGTDQEDEKETRLEEQMISGNTDLS